MAYNFRSQTEAIEASISRLYREIYIPLCDLDIEAFVTPEPMPFSEKTRGRHKILKKGDVWGNPWDCGWFHFIGTVPMSAKGKKVVLYLNVHGEMGIFDETGEIIQGITSGSVFVPEQDLGCFGIKKCEYVVTESAKGGEPIDLWADAGCNHIVGVDGSSRLELGKIEHADISVCRDNVKELFYDAFILYDLLMQHPKDSARYHALHQALFDVACELADYTDDEIERASAILKRELDKKGGDPDLEITAIGHSHIDLAWLWPIRETKRKGARTFANALCAMEKYPDYIFGASQPQLFQWIKDEHPALYARVKERVKEGRFEVQGGMWVEPDANVTGGESLVRQLLYGKRFFKEEFGEDMKILWLPDVFGYSAALPQILTKSSVPYFMSSKLVWGNRHNKHPHQTFLWKGIDGSEVLAHMPPEGEYSSYAMPRSIKKIEREYEDKARCGEALMPFGVGDGGGGPSELQLEALKREKNLSGLLPVKQERAVDFFDRIAEKKARYETYNGELYFEKHQGTYTSQARNKWYNRKMEKLLREAEFAAVATGVEYPQKELEKIWKEVLLYQFHDILPGSSIKRVYDECLSRYESLYKETQALVGQIYGEGDYAINSLSWDRNGWQKLGDKWYQITVPAMGSVKLEDGVVSREVASDDVSVLENNLVKVLFDDNGAINSIYDKIEGREVLKQTSNQLTVYFDDGDAWDFNESYRSRAPRCFTLVKAQAFTDGPMKGIRQEYVYQNSRLWQTVSVTEDSPMVVFDTKVDWNERERMLRTAFYTTIQTDEATCDIQYGSIKRPAHNNTSWDMAKFEVCAHKYTDLSDSSYGVALMNDCKYGYCVKNGMLDLNLLRSPNYPDETADNAVHFFRYALYPHTGTLMQSDVLQKSYEFNQPLWVGAEIPQLVAVSNPDIVIESVKKAEDDNAIIIRMYESKGGCCETAVRFGKQVRSAQIVDMMEENGKPADLDAIRLHGFEIVTLKIEL